jgi:hypothetical protein
MYSFGNTKATDRKVIFNSVDSLAASKGVCVFVVGGLVCETGVDMTENEYKEQHRNESVAPAGIAFGANDLSPINKLAQAFDVLHARLGRTGRNTGP